MGESDKTLNIAVIGSGIAGLSAAWLLSSKHDVTLYEAEDWLGGHSHTVEAQGQVVDTGFIVYNERTYPNLTALFAHLQVETTPTEMTLGISLENGGLQYAGSLGGFVAQPRNLVRGRYWRMWRDLVRFYRHVRADCAHFSPETSLQDYLEAKGYSTAFREDHLYPMAAAIWSVPSAQMGAYPLHSFVRFCDNHGLINFLDRPIWRTVVGGSRAYVARLRASLPHIRMQDAVRRISRDATGVQVESASGTTRYDHVVIAAHADQGLAMLADPSGEEQRILGSFSYQENAAVLHSDPALMPSNRRIWSSWNYIGGTGGDESSDENGEAETFTAKPLMVSYYMNRLQRIGKTPMFLTLNPVQPPAAARTHHSQIYQHPIFDARAVKAQAELWSVQGVNRTWFCGAYFGAGFHEDGLQAGLAVAEALGGVRRPWSVAGESARIILPISE
jgi:uncharacterized protein